MTAGRHAGEGVPASAASAQQAVDTAAYRRSPYPSFIHPLTHPDRLATIARLAGMTPPDIRTARVLEIGVGDGLNLLAMAQSQPGARFVGFDLEADGIARGQDRLRASGLTNVELHVADLMDGAAAIDGDFDYIIAHGVFAWVPEAVASALLRLIADRLTADGVAFVSFNALPGGYAKMAVRDAMLRATAGAADDGERLARARALLRAAVVPRSNDGPLQKGYRSIVQERLDRHDGVLLHDELSEAWRPWYLREALDLARPLGLTFLGDASNEQVMEALVTEEGATPASVQTFVEARACAEDDLAFRMFRRLLLVRDTAAPSRRLDPRRIEELFAASYAGEPEPGVFASGPRRISCDHPALQTVLRRLIATSPERVRVRDLGLDDAYLRALIGLYDYDILSLHTVPGSCSCEVPDPPVASALARTMVAEGLDWAATLDHRVVNLDAGARRVLAMLDGNSDRATLLERLDAERIDGTAALTGLARMGFLTR